MRTIIMIVIALTIVFTWISNSIRNNPPITSQSLHQLMLKVIKRHPVAVPIIIIILIMIPITLHRWGILIDGLFVILLSHWCYKVILSTRKRTQYLRSIEPNYKSHPVKIRLSPEDNKKLGGHNLHYAFIGQDSKTITFPESKYGNSRKYYLTKIQFKPAYGPNYLRLTYNGNKYTRKALFKDMINGKAYDRRITEIPTVAIVTLKALGTSQSFQIKLHDQLSGNVTDFKKNWRALNYNLHSGQIN